MKGFIMSSRNGPQIRLAKASEGPLLSVWIEEYGDNKGEDRVAEPVIFRTATRDEMQRSDRTPYLQLSLQAAQTLSDDLASLGIVPRGGVAL